MDERSTHGSDRASNRGGLIALAVMHRLMAGAALLLCVATAATGCGGKGGHPSDVEEPLGGAPAFKPAGLYRVPQDAGDDPGDLAIVDVNDDRTLDVVVAIYSGRVVVFFGTGGGDLRLGPTYSTAEAATAIATGDVNGDGRRDIVIGNQSTSSVDLFLGHGDGTFAASHPVRAGTWPRDVVLKDVNGDNHLDLITANLRGTQVSVLLGNGDGSFRDAATIPGHGASALAVADLNGDGAYDFATTTGTLNSGGVVSILLSEGDGTYRRNGTLEVGFNPLDIAAGDLNADGRIDLVTANNEVPNSLTILLGGGDGSFTRVRDLRVSPHDNASSVALANIDGSGGLDIVTAASILLGVGNGDFGTAIAYNPVSGEENALADLNGDGRLDIAASDWGGPPDYGAGLLRVFLSHGSAPLCIVPKLLGNTPSTATRLLRERGCSRGRVDLVPDPSRTPAGRVVDQSLPPGARAVNRTPVSLSVKEPRSSNG